jgi:hypothetical protein
MDLSSLLREIRLVDERLYNIVIVNGKYNRKGVDSILAANGLPATSNPVQALATILEYARTTRYERYTDSRVGQKRRREEY